MTSSVMDWWLMKWRRSLHRYPSRAGSILILWKSLRTISIFRRQTSAISIRYRYFSIFLLAASSSFELSVPNRDKIVNRDISASRKTSFGTPGQSNTNRDCPGQTGTFGQLRCDCVTCGASSPMIGRPRPDGRSRRLWTFNHIFWWFILLHLPAT